MTLKLITRRLSWALLLTIPLWFGCSKKDTDITPSAASIQGSWRQFGYTIDPAFDITGSGTKVTDILEAFKSVTGGAQFVDCYKSVTITFNADGQITGTVSIACSGIDASIFGSTATWSATGSKVKITEGAAVQEYDATISGTTLKLSQTFVDDFDNDGKTETATVSYAMTKV
ncbi:lipocalin family protein [Fibrella arboris]|uniref:lipocalin family protein n=1 Tax=Fibrella arboris TaxID=3242486 RepID=UPI00351FE18C